MAPVPKYLHMVSICRYLFFSFYKIEAISNMRQEENDVLYYNL